MKRTHPLDLASLQQRLLSSPLRFLLIPLSWLYGLIVSIRNRCYAIGVFRTRTLPCRVVSVGNIAVGGTGKTPAVIAIAKRLQQKGVRVAILLRGYKRVSREQVTIVSDGERVCASLEESGDEASMLARHLKGIPIVVGRQRYQAGRVALERFNVDVLFLDDGFQHRQLARDVDILTIPVAGDLVESVEALDWKKGRMEGWGAILPPFHSSFLPFQYGKKLLPAGTLREPWTALQRADIILLTRTDAVDMLQGTKTELQRLAPSALILESIHQPVRLYPLSVTLAEKTITETKWKRTYPAALQISNPPNLTARKIKKIGEMDLLSIEKALEGKRILAVCGIGSPDAFVATLRQYSPAHVVLLAFPDHHVYTAADVTEIDAAFQTSRADLIVTTQKDEQKLVDLVADRELVITVLEIALVIIEGVEKFDALLLPEVL